MVVIVVEKLAVSLAVPQPSVGGSGRPMKATEAKQKKMVYRNIWMKNSRFTKLFHFTCSRSTTTYSTKEKYNGSLKPFISKKKITIVRVV